MARAKAAKKAGATGKAKSKVGIIYISYILREREVELISKISLSRTICHWSREDSEMQML